MKSSKPLLWIPSLYLGESLPYAAVMLMSVVLYQEMGLTDTQITLYTGWLGLPWVIKPLWSPIVDGIKTKRWWILAMQLLMGAALALLAFTLPTEFWLQCSLALFMLVAFSSAVFGPLQSFIEHCRRLFAACRRRRIFPLHAELSHRRSGNPQFRREYSDVSE